MLIDCHTHDTTRTDAIISVSPALFRPEEGKHYSVGIHPWETGATLDFELLERAAAHPSVAAIGETGVDRLRGAGMTRKPTFSSATSPCRNRCANH